jgi:hypothetical protein
MEFTKMAADRGATLAVYDLERLRSLLDSSLKDIRRRYLHLDDDVSAEIRSKVTTLLRFPEKQPLDTATMSLPEEMYRDKRPAQLFALLQDVGGDVLRTIPEVGTALETLQRDYYQFSRAATRLFGMMMAFVGAKVAVRFRAGWRIYVRYAFMRLNGVSRADIEADGDFLNYGITWDDAERVSTLLAGENAIMAEVRTLGTAHDALLAKVEELRTILVK